MISTIPLQLISWSISASKVQVGHQHRKAPEKKTGDPLQAQALRGEVFFRPQVWCFQKWRSMSRCSCYGCSYRKYIYIYIWLKVNEICIFVHSVYVYMIYIDIQYMIRIPPTSSISRVKIPSLPATSSELRLPTGQPDCSIMLRP